MQKVGWIGTGVMGASMCGHLLAKGFPVTLHTRTRAKADPLVERGAAWADSPAAVAAASDVVFLMVGLPADVRACVFGDSGVLAAARPGTVLVDMSTSEPALAREIADAAARQNLHAVDAPVSGGDVGAREARLSIMIGGEPEVVKALDPFFAAMGKTWVHQGPAGAG